MLEFKPYASGSSGNMYTVTDGKTTLMIEAGISEKKISKALDFDYSGFSGLLVSHEHGDHSKSAVSMMHKGIDCYASNETFEALGVGEHHRAKRIEAKKQFDIGTFKILPFEVEHDVKTFGFLIQNEAGERLLFATDTYYIRHLFNGLTIIAVECNYSQELLNQRIADGSTHKLMKRRLHKSHFELGNVKEFLKSNDLSQVEDIYLLHMSSRHGDAKQFKEEVQAVTGKPVTVA